jgi:hypothetical protein
MSDEIIELCLYTDKFQNISYIRNSDKNTCNEYENKELITKIYSINPEFRPIPFGSVLFCADYSETSNPETLSIEQMYDPFNIEKKCVKFIGWKENVPYTTPLYIISSENGVYLTFDDKIENKNLKKETIFVLLNTDKKFKIENNIPNFLFKNSNGVCIPDPNGTSLTECIKNSPSYFTILDQLNYFYGNSKQSKIYYFLFFTILFFLILIILNISFRK